MLPLPLTLDHRLWSFSWIIFFFLWFFSAEFDQMKTLIIDACLNFIFGGNPWTPLSNERKNLPHLILSFAHVSRLSFVIWLVVIFVILSSSRHSAFSSLTFLLPHHQYHLDCFHTWLHCSSHSFVSIHHFVTVFSASLYLVGLQFPTAAHTAIFGANTFPLPTQMQPHRS